MVEINLAISLTFLSPCSSVADERFLFQTANEQREIINRRISDTPKEGLRKNQGKRTKFLGKN